ncbi:MAG: N-6 DNA methylase [Planctomycetota bacterium]|nr:N-6 DNA methylase [Planctomycetota bacterium]
MPDKATSIGYALTEVASDAVSLNDEELGLSQPPIGKSVIGRVNTPANVARWMATTALDCLDNTRDASDPTILEPAAGSGVIVGALFEALVSKYRGNGARPLRSPLRHIWAIDNDASVQPASARRLANLAGREAYDWARRQYKIGDALLDDSLLPPRPIDLIIGNPPYLGLRHASRLPEFERWRGCFGVREDLYALFIRRAMATIRPGGVIAFLLPDGWLSLASYEQLRRRLLQGNVRHVVRLPAGTFDRVVFPSILIWQSAPPRGPMTYTDARGGGLANPDACILTDPSVFLESPRATFFVPTPEQLALSALWRGIGASSGVIRLERAVRIADAGIHSRNCRHRLFFPTRNKPGLQRLVQGRQIEAFALRWNAPSAQYRWVDIHYRPRPRTLGRRGNGRPSVRDEYWDWQGDPAVHRLRERVLIRQTGDRIIAARCLQKRAVHYTDNTLFTVTLTEQGAAQGLSLAYLTAYLNCEIVTRLYRFLSGEHGRPQAQIKVRLLRQLPFIPPTHRQRKRIESLVDRLERAVRRGETERAAQRAMNSHFERLFTSAGQVILHHGCSR